MRKRLLFLLVVSFVIISMLTPAIVSASSYASGWKYYKKPGGWLQKVAGRNLSASVNIFWSRCRWGHRIVKATAGAKASSNLYVVASKVQLNKRKVTLAWQSWGFGVKKIIKNKTSWSKISESPWRYAGTKYGAYSKYGNGHYACSSTSWHATPKYSWGPWYTERTGYQYRAYARGYYRGGGQSYAGSWIMNRQVYNRSAGISYDEFH